MVEFSFYYIHDGRKIMVTAYREDIVKTDSGEFIAVRRNDTGKIEIIALPHLKCDMKFIPQFAKSAREVHPVTYAGMERTPQD